MSCKLPCLIPSAIVLFLYQTQPTFVCFHQVLLHAVASSIILSQFHLPAAHISLLFLWVLTLCILLNYLPPPFLIPPCLHVIGVCLCNHGLQLQVSPGLPCILHSIQGCCKPSSGSCKPSSGCTWLRTALNHGGDKGLSAELETEVNFCLSLHS